MEIGKCYVSKPHCLNLVHGFSLSIINDGPPVTGMVSIIGHAMYYKAIFAMILCLCPYSYGHKWWLLLAPAADSSSPVSFLSYCVYVVLQPEVNPIDKFQESQILVLSSRIIVNNQGLYALLSAFHPSASPGPCISLLSHK